jgi:hypothetical protein
MRLTQAGNLLIGTNKFIVAGATGNTTIAGTLGVTGDFSVNTNKFTVAGATGNTTIAGTLGVTGAITGASYSGGAISGTTGTFNSTLSATGNLTINTNKFIVTATTGNTVVAGTLSSVGDFSVNTDKFTVESSSGNATSKGIISAESFRNNGFFADSSCRFGKDALASTGSATFNTAFGAGSLKLTDVGSSNSAFGYKTLGANTSGYLNNAFGYECLVSNETGYENNGFGTFCLYSNETGYQNNGFGQGCLYSNTTGYQNNGFGKSCLYFNETGYQNSAFGNFALSQNIDYSNCSGIGAYAQVTGSNQVQLGNSATTTYVYGTVQNRSDERDKADIVDCSLGLDFIEKIRPINFKWDLREDYKEIIETKKIIINEDGEEQEVPTIEVIQHEKDGSKKRSRYHSGVSAQQVKTVLDEMNTDWGGYQDHTINGGSDRLTIGYDEFIAPLIKAVQELSAKNKALEAQNISILSRLEALENA